MNETAAKVAIVGGSIAGMAMAHVLGERGYAATVYECRDEWIDRGLGMCLPSSVFEEAMRRGFLGKELAPLSMSKRWWLTAHEPNRDGSQQLWVQDFPQQIMSIDWKLLWRSLRDHLPTGVQFVASQYSGTKTPASTADGRVTEVTVDDAGVDVGFANGTHKSFDYIVGADGKESIVRDTVFPGRTPKLAPYVCWRGCTAVDLIGLLPVPLQEGDTATVGFPGGHAMFYLVRGQSGHTFVNWLIYAKNGKDTFKNTKTLLPGEWRWLIDNCIPGPKHYWDVEDLTVNSYASGRALLCGDASTFTRLHTSIAATKALEDAFAFDDILARGLSWDAAIEQYNAERVPVGNSLVEWGRRIGHTLVEEPPVWRDMDDSSLAEWVKDIAPDNDHYLYTKPAA